MVFVMTNVGGSLTVSPEGMEEYVRRKPDWSKFVEACFEPGSELNRKLKQMVLNMAEKHSPPHYKKSHRTSELKYGEIFCLV